MIYSELKKYINEGLILERIHPENKNIRIFNYSSKCQFDKKWDNNTMLCRGLIMNIETNEILSNPFPKFFNWEEHIQLGKSIPGEIPIIQEKVDGWLGILYWLNDLPYIATRGSFTSIGAIWATNWFRKNIFWESLDRRYTHLFEIISPETKIVINYNFEGLVWLTSRHLKTGKDVLVDDLLSLESHIPALREKQHIHMRSAKILTEHDKNFSLEKLKSLEKSNEEGFVLIWASGLRLKIKFDEYKRLHKILTNISPSVIWEYLKDNNNIETILDRVPDEFYQWVKDTKENILNKFNDIEKETMSLMKIIKEKITRKEQAEYVITTKYPSILFAMLDDKDYKKHIWKLIKPSSSKTFKQDI
ncbi:TPA: hypothetical protein DIU22_02065 [Candidatus Woesebacteria bacterium]|nr:hypothetical protein [Candidatus Woesebacteria bacterium]